MPAMRRTSRRWRGRFRSLSATLRGAPEECRSSWTRGRCTRATDSRSRRARGASTSWVRRMGSQDGFDELDRTADDMDLGEGLVVRVAALEDLIRMKRAAGQTEGSRGARDPRRTSGGDRRASRTARARRTRRSGSLIPYVSAGARARRDRGPRGHAPGPHPRYRSMAEGPRRAAAACRRSNG